MFQIAKKVENIKSRRECIKLKGIAGQWFKRKNGCKISLHSRISELLNYDAYHDVAHNKISNHKVLLSLT
jgi:hypothetical protein